MEDRCEPRTVLRDYGRRWHARLRGVSEHEDPAFLPDEVHRAVQRGRTAISGGSPGRRALDEADRVHAAGYRRLFAAGKYQSRYHALPPGTHRGAIDDSADCPAGDHVAQGISRDSLATRQRQRPGIAGVSRASEDVSAAVEFVQAALPGQARPDAGKN